MMEFMKVKEESSSRFTNFYYLSSDWDYQGTIYQTQMVTHVVIALTRQLDPPSEGFQSFRLVIDTFYIAIIT